MGYPRWIPLHTTDTTTPRRWVVGECADGHTQYDEVARFRTLAEAEAYMGKRRREVHTARTMRWRRARTEVTSG